MLGTIAAAAVGTAAGAAYLDAKFLIRNDLALAPLNPNTRAAQKFLAKAEGQGKLRVYYLLEAHALAAQSDQLFLEFEDRSWTYKEFYNCIQRVGRWLLDELEIRPGEMVAISGPNTPEYVMLWMALQAIGAAVSHVNCHLVSDALLHCVKISEARYFLMDRDHEQGGYWTRDRGEEDGVTAVAYGRDLFESMPDKGAIAPEKNSGVSQRRPHHLSTRALKASDKFYTCLPLYHGAAQGLCMSPVIYAGASIRLGRRFSHKTFWPEVAESQATRLQYVGEICRYLVNAPTHPLERSHQVEEAWGNGMRPDVWERFRQRFQIPVIHELYAGTDAVSASFNRNHGSFGRNAIAVRGAMSTWMLSEREVRGKIDPDTEELLRDAQGFAIRAGTNEPGEVLHRVDETSVPFVGYHNNSAASRQRYLRDVFQPGDVWFRSGDMMRVDAHGRVYFVDRLGDTFRWKSENVSTAEVADTLSGFAQVAECAVYGVTVPHADGRCGCAMIVPTSRSSLAGKPGSLDVNALSTYLLERLPRYAVPVFIRIASELRHTGNYKIQKGHAKKEGVDLRAIQAPGGEDFIFWLLPGSNSYVPYRMEDWNLLQNGKVKL